MIGLECRDDFFPTVERRRFGIDGQIHIPALAEVQLSFCTGFEGVDFRIHPAQQDVRALPLRGRHDLEGHAGWFLERFAVAKQPLLAIQSTGQREGSKSPFELEFWNLEHPRKLQLAREPSIHHRGGSP